MNKFETASEFIKRVENPEVVMPETKEAVDIILGFSRNQRRHYENLTTKKGYSPEKAIAKIVFTLRPFRK